MEKLRNMNSFSLSLSLHDEKRKRKIASRQKKKEGIARGGKPLENENKKKDFPRELPTYPPVGANFFSFKNNRQPSSYRQFFNFSLLRQQPLYINIRISIIFDLEV